MPHQQESDAADDESIIDSVCDVVEKAWKSGSQPDLRQCLPAGRESMHRDMLLQMILVDRWYRRKQGLTATLESYLESFPELRPLESLPTEFVAQVRDTTAEWETQLVPGVPGRIHAPQIPGDRASEPAAVRNDAGNTGHSRRPRVPPQQNDAARHGVQESEVRGPDSPDDRNTRTVIPLETFTRSLADSNLLSDKEIVALQKSLKPTDSLQFAKALVKRQSLTKYQAEQILNGKSKSLVLGNYVILEKIGQGGMGQVLKAKHRRMDRTVALKILPPDVVKSPDAVQRFQREVKAAAKLEHPNIVTAHDADEANGTHFFVMQYVDGHDLSSIIKTHGRMSVPRAVHCLEQAARGLEYAHERGIVHRDIKPANLLLSKDDTLKILDLGLATMTDNDGVVDHGLTGTGAIMGTVDFMAPEQGVNTKRADARSDIYSLGCTFYYLLTARVPYRGETAVEKILAHRDQPIPDLGRERPDLPASLLQMFQRMVAKEPADRYQTMSEVLAALRGVSAAASTINYPETGSAPFDPALQKFFDAQGAKAAEPSALTATVIQSEFDVSATFAETLNSASVHTASLVTKRPTKTNREKTNTLKAPAGAKPPSGRRRWLMAAGGGLGGLLLCGIIIITITNKDGKKTTIKVPEGVETNVNAAPGSKVDIVQQDDPASSSPSPMESIAADAPINYVVEQMAAEWVWSVGGTVGLVNAEGGYSHPDDGKLPDGNWALLSVNLVNCQAVRDEDLERLSGCRRLRDLNLALTPVTGSGLKHLVPIRSLTTLDLNGLGGTPNVQPGTSLKDNMLAPLAQMPQLTNLVLANNIAITDDALVPIARLTNLERLELYNHANNITDRGLAHLTALHKLKFASLTSGMITDQGVAEVINNNPELTELIIDNMDQSGQRTLLPLTEGRNIKKVVLGGDQLTAEGLAVLQQLPLLESVTISVPITDAAVTRLNDLPNLNHVRLYFWKGGYVPPHAGYTALAKHPGVSTLLLQGNGGGSPSDAELLALTTMPNLSELYLSFSDTNGEKRNYTAAGIDALRKARPDVHLIVDGTDYPAIVE